MAGINDLRKIVQPVGEVVATVVAREDNGLRLSTSTGTALVPYPAFAVKVGDRVILAGGQAKSKLGTEERLPVYVV